ncbi:MAG: hemerythrin domain-containing protein [Marmoricola sp.]
MPDILDVILSEHEEFRLQFAHFEAITDADEQRSRWEPLQDLLEVHAAAEEAVFYPEVVRALHDGTEETKDAVHEHNEIRDAIGEIEEHQPGTELFLLAVKQVQAANAHHMAEEESEVLPQFRDATDAALREELGDRFCSFKDQHPGAKGISSDKTDAQQVVDRSSGDGEER